ncbi:MULTISPECIES: hypothetical protein [unclassified Iodidimonas]|jgi:hypothetical protein|uniref:hypothetical protein n=1 Tax=unclassified Iodidimonas TaxID=2626145 RepID=UPI0024829AD5|nr:MULTISPECIES: hypothetical protein [unclassified Iodidimonas]
MENPLIALGALLGVLLLIALNRFMGGWQPARLKSTAAAMARYQQDYWHDEIMDAVVDQKGRTALMALRGHAVGLVVAMGDGFVTRRLQGPALLSIDPLADGDWAIRLRDFTLKRALILWPEDADQAVWLNRLHHLAATPQNQSQGGAPGAFKAHDA